MNQVDRGLMLHRQGKLDKAEEQYILAIGENFDDWQALLYLGTLYLQRGMIGLSAQCLMRSLDMNKDNFEAWNNLGNCFKARNKDDDAKLCWEKALSIKDRSKEDYADVYNNLCTLYINAGRPKEAEVYAKKCIDIVPEHADGNWNYGLIELEQGHFGAGFDKYPWGFKTRNRNMREYGDNVKYWNGEKNGVVVVWGEQGIGDEILFSSMLPDLIKVSKKVILDCHPRLVNIFKQSFPDLTIFGTRKDELINWHKDFPDLRYKLSMGDLGKHFRRSLDKFPGGEKYLRTTPERVAYWKGKLDKLGSRMKVGISWTGGYVKTRKDFRSISMDQWGPILKNNADFISLQYTPEAYAVCADIEDRFDTKIHHWPSAVHNDDYNETAALVEALDLVITVNTSIHHLAGALGKKCWTMTPVGKAWRYWSPDADGHSVPWYKSVYQYQQQELGNWEPIINRVAEDLKLEIEKR